MTIISGTGSGPLTRSILRVLEMETKAPEQPEFEMKSNEFEFKASDDETNVIEGYAATFGGAPDSHGDIIEVGAFTQTLKERGDRIKFLWSHNWNEVIGRVTEAHEDEKGLYIKVKISDTQRGRETMTLIKDGTIDRMSIGYRTIDYKYDDNGFRRLKQVSLFEVSAVPIPSNDNAEILKSKQSKKPASDPYGEASGIDAIEMLLEEVKAGKAISAKTEKAITDAISGMKSAVSSLETLLDAVHKEEGDDPGDKGKSGVDEEALANMVKAFLEGTETK